jgi:hypothetical protein
MFLKTGKINPNLLTASLVNESFSPNATTNFSGIALWLHKLDPC